MKFDCRMKNMFAVQLFAFTSHQSNEYFSLETQSGQNQFDEWKKTSNCSSFVFVRRFHSGLQFNVCWFTSTKDFHFLCLRRSKISAWVEENKKIQTWRRSETNTFECLFKEQKESIRACLIYGKSFVKSAFSNQSQLLTRRWSRKRFFTLRLLMFLSLLTNLQIFSFLFLLRVPAACKCVALHPTYH